MSLLVSAQAMNAFTRCLAQLWWIIAWIRVFEVTGNQTYLNVSATNFDTMVTQYSLWDNQYGGVFWNSNTDYRNVITNSLFFTASSLLALYSGINYCTHLVPLLATTGKRYLLVDMQCE
jgi:uncharacterized protein YyaL (SSP411 family)